MVGIARRRNQLRGEQVLEMWILHPSSGSAAAVGVDQACDSCLRRKGQLVIQEKMPAQKWIGIKSPWVFRYFMCRWCRGSEKRQGRGFPVISWKPDDQVLFVSDQAGDGTIQIPVAVVEFADGGRAIWVHDGNGCTVLRIQCTGRVTVSKACENISAHADINVVGDIAFCVPDAKRSVG